ncbi:MAG: hypothetical protein AVDCRST_MAG68-236, partial [uncultured Gemmatimonadetes bacterium]
ASDPGPAGPHGAPGHGFRRGGAGRDPARGRLSPALPPDLAHHRLRAAADRRERVAPERAWRPRHPGRRGLGGVGRLHALGARVEPQPRGRALRARPAAAGERPRPAAAGRGPRVGSARGAAGGLRAGRVAGVAGGAAGLRRALPARGDPGRRRPPPAGDRGGRGHRGGRGGPAADPGAGGLRHPPAAERPLVRLDGEPRGRLEPHRVLHADVPPGVRRGGRGGGGAAVAPGPPRRVRARAAPPGGGGAAADRV